MFVERKVATEACTPFALTNLDLKKEETLLPLKKVGLGTAVKLELDAGCDISDDKKVKFKKECLTMHVKLTEKLIERSPLRYNIVRHASCFDPLEMVNYTDACVLKGNRIIQYLFQCTWLNEKQAERARKLSKQGS